MRVYFPVGVMGHYPVGLDYLTMRIMMLIVEYLIQYFLTLYSVSVCKLVKLRRKNHHARFGSVLEIKESGIYENC